jgi:cell division protein FtsI (penicillin-binding protein 3)
VAVTLRPMRPGANGPKRPKRPDGPRFSKARFGLTPQRQQQWQAQVATRSFRLILAWLTVLAGLGGLSIKLFQLQILQAKDLSAQAKDQQTSAMRPNMPRRSVVDSNGHILAIDQSVYTLYVHPKLFVKERGAIVDALAPVLGTPKADLLAKIGDRKSGVELAQDLPENTVRRLKNLNIDGLEYIPHQQRLYPYKDLFATVVGYVDGDRKGQAGLELGQQEQLERPMQALRVRRTGNGLVVPTQLPSDFLRQDDLKLKLTLDNRIQRAARDALKVQMDAWGAKRGTVLVMDARDGAMLAMVSGPSYDPNEFYKSKVENFKNWAVSDLYEPGSTFKPINVAIALESGAIRAGDNFYDEGQIQMEGHTIQNSDFLSAGGRGTLSIAQILQYSSNIGMIRIAQRMQPGVYHDWLERLGVGKTVGTDLPSAPAGELKSRQEFIQSPIEPATASFGQGLSITPLQLIQMHGTLANGGHLVTPHVIAGLVDSQDKVIWQPDLPEPKRVFSPQNTQAVLEMMETVVTDGTGKTAAIPGYRIAGKTGTAQKAENGRYVEGARITSFVGILPVNAPRYVIIAVMDEPQGENAYGSTVSAPIVKSVMQALINTVGVAPAAVDTPVTTSPPVARP